MPDATMAAMLILTLALQSIISTCEPLKPRTIKPSPPHHSPAPTCPLPTPTKAIELGLSPPGASECCIENHFKDKIVRNFVPYPQCPARRFRQNQDLCKAVQELMDPPFIKSTDVLVPIGTTFQVKTNTVFRPDPNNPNFQIAEIVAEIDRPDSSIAILRTPYGCYNFAPPGTDVIPVFCFNDLIGAEPFRTLSDLISEKSIVTAGDVVFNENEVDLGVLIGGNMRATHASGAPVYLWERGNCASQHSVDPFRDAAVWVGGLVNDNRGPPPYYDVGSGQVSISNLNDEPYPFLLSDGDQLRLMTAEEAEVGRKTIAARLCSAASQMGLARQTGLVIGEATLRLVCVFRPAAEFQSKMCYLDIEAEQLEKAKRIININFGSFDEIVLRVSGSGVINFDVFDTTDLTETIQRVKFVTREVIVDGVPTVIASNVTEVFEQRFIGSERIMLFFRDADTVNVHFAAQQAGTRRGQPAAIFAPLAKSVNVFIDASSGPISEARFLLGDPESTLTFLSGGILPSDAAFVGLLPIFDIFDVRIDYCDCLCDPAELPVEEVRLRCVEDEEFRRAELIIESQEY
eukprot:Selendium_serpulae@DN6308_c0_g1_i7.p1